MLGPESARMLCCLDVVRQESHWTPQAENRPGLVPFVNVKVATVIRRINRNAERLEVVRNGVDWPSKLRGSYVTTDGLEL